jgi:small subunit ribosomal protein S6
MFILDPNRYSRDPNGVSTQITAMVEKAGGEVLVSRLWNEQRLAYPIQGHRKGAYWLTYFRMETANLAEFDRDCRLNDNVLRNLTLRVEPRLVETLVAHARGESVATANESAESAPATEPAPATEKAPATESPSSSES